MSIATGGKQPQAAAMGAGGGGARIGGGAGAGAGGNGAGNATTDADADLQARLDNLRREWEPIMSSSPFYSQNIYDNMLFLYKNKKL